MLSKEQLRAELKLQRKNMSAVDVAEKSIKAAECFLQSEIYKKSQTLMLYMPLGNETDTSKIIAAATADGKKTVFPVTDFASGVITPCYAEKSTLFKKGAFSVNEPQCTATVDMDEINTIVIPGIAFDKNGARIGFGKGCYDMFLQNSRAVKVGFCYQFQLLEKFFSESHDIKMDYIVTENGLFKCL